MAFTRKGFACSLKSLKQHTRAGVILGPRLGLEQEEDQTAFQRPWVVYGQDGLLPLIS